ncbi:MAG TPA: ATP-dependent helicase [Burkholderiaceae bacterium]|nr:ATP-dependent helicase [Burkholderiaceae bacterium]
MRIDASTCSDPFAVLNAEQRRAVEHGVDSSGPQPLLVIAGAGTGKTMTLAARLARLVLAGADPQRIMMLTFSRRAAQEMERRAGRMLHAALGLRATQAPPALPWAGTFHSVGARLLREMAAATGLAPSFTVLDRSDAEDLMGLARESLGLAASARRFPLKGTCLAIHSRVVNAQLDVTTVLRAHFPWCAGWEDELHRLLRAYVHEKQRQHALDYDDLLLYWQQMMRERALATAVSARFDHVLVDEYQDTNRLQASILRLLKPDGRGLTAVGDDAQSIYSFRAADVRNILEFPTQFEPAARVVVLTRNYRCTQAILDASNAVIGHSSERYRKDLWTDKAGFERPRLVAVADAMEQARRVADDVLAQRETGLKLRQQAVLFRAGHHSAELELELTRRGVPFVKFGGLRFIEASHVKDLLSLLRWLHNPRARIAGFRAAQLVAGIGPASARRLLDAMDAAVDPLMALQDFDAPAVAMAAWREFVDLTQTLRCTAWPGEVALVATWLQPHLDRLHDDARVRAADLAQLARIAAGYASRERFLTDLTLDPPEATSDEARDPQPDDDYLILSTMHSAKGQEWQAVHLLHMVDGCMPADLATGSAADIEEERRLLYVAMTRAKRHLTLMVPLRYHVTQQARHGDRHLYAGLTRFIPPVVAKLFDEVTPAMSRAADNEVPQEAVIDLPARVRNLG